MVWDNVLDTFVASDVDEFSDNGMDTYAIYQRYCWFIACYVINIHQNMYIA